ncbi:SDR family oxidoreductase [Thalassoglobus polymorphus]|uniref:3-oxoacyl-[acyl-carrier-protein] reductase FabG n=1 Tax=Thalassoglobus polymorphus TaxID=2527994 RepID=A0A517QTP1_9PLAN|nr:SDR family oxidoreductase [Thalassoglobus polymorphus]QDT34907.1 3-oxoacyl-[acyl-carrier-protein] reductase FabG [Thalassoglobus polymorphus]
MISIDLSGKVAVVTGGIQGLGKATATMLKHAGAQVAVNYFDDAEGISRGRAATLAEEWGGNGFVAAADVRSRSEMKQFYEQTKEKFGRIDFLVNNAAVLRDRSIKNMTDEEWDTVIETNLSSVFRASQSVTPYLEKGGRIVNMASISGVIGFYGQANYASAKAGVITLTKVLSRELASKGINVNAVAPGVVLTEMGESIPDAARQKMLEQIPLNRFGEPEEIASTILFLCSDLSSYITGQTLHVNGGWWAA